ncbi:MAG: hypothetical protein V1708_05040 [Candidatus Micrarchaeota archaeon]
MDNTIRGIDAMVYREAKAEAARRSMPIGKAVSEALRMWLGAAQTRFRKRKKPFYIKPMRYGAGTENLSKEVDKVLYG